MELHLKHNSLSKVAAELASSVSLVTKTLKLQRIGKSNDNRKLVISTNWLNLMNFHAGDEVVEEVTGNLQGMVVRPATSSDAKPKLVYQRGYKNRDDETLMDIRSQSKIDPAFGSAERVHITMQRDLITIKPIFAPEARATNKHLEVKVEAKNGLYSGILDTLEFIKEHAFKAITFDADEAFLSTQERVLLCIQLRRLGYQLESNGKQILAYFDKEIIDNLPKTDYSIQPKQSSEPLFNFDDPFSVFSACTGGVDIYGLEQDGFTTRSICEFRPPEKRDFKKKTNSKTGESEIVHTDKTEHCAISAAINAKGITNIYNEDIYDFDCNQVVKGQHNLFQVSFQCDDFSNLKNKGDQEAAIESLDTTRDMFIPGTNMIKKLEVPAVLMENVKNFKNSKEHDLFLSQLDSQGFKTYSAILRPKELGGYTNRERNFVFATKLDAPFAFPTGQAEGTGQNVWKDIIEPKIHQLRNITHTKTLQKALTSGRLRVIKEGDAIAPTITKSQSRQVKDSVYVQIGDQYYIPSNEMLMDMMAIDLGFNLEPFSGEMSSEIIGQSCDLKVHRAIGQAIKDHFNAYMASFKGSYESGEQMALFA